MVVLEGFGIFSPRALLRICSEASMLRSFSSTYLHRTGISHLLRQISTRAWPTQVVRHGVQQTRAKETHVKGTYQSLCRSSQDFCLSSAAFQSLPGASTSKLSRAARLSFPSAQCRASALYVRAVGLHTITCPWLVSLSKRNFEKFLKTLSDSSTMEADACLNGGQI